MSYESQRIAPNREQTVKKEGEIASSRFNRNFAEIVRIAPTPEGFD
jgi:hypothetical protein